MTLNITVATSRCIYQSADYRLLDLNTNRHFDFETQKIVVITRFGWNATVCFCGIGRTTHLDVTEWLADCVDSIGMGEPFERLLAELMKADEWLSTVSLTNRKHSFTVGAFVGSEPRLVLISNFEKPSIAAAATADPVLSQHELRITKPVTLVAGVKQSVSRRERRWLASMAARDPEPERMYSALAEVNRNAAKCSARISPSCFTTHVHLIGQGGGKLHDIGDRPFLPKFAMIQGTGDAFKNILDEHFGPGLARLGSISMARSEASDDYHETQLREKPDDAQTHSNYGAFLKDVKKDPLGAEREYLKALDLDPKCANALGNLANLSWEKGDRELAAALYQKGLEADSANENIGWNYARFLLREFDERQKTREVLDQALTAHPESARLLLLRAELSLKNGAAEEALEGFRRSREQGAEQADVEAGYAFALQLSGAPDGECIAAYRVAITLNPRDGALKLNLAQLLFIRGDHTEANKQLQEAMGLELDESAQLEAQFYILAHNLCDTAVVFRTTKTLLSRDARLRWNVAQNIESVGQNDPEKAELLELVRQVMAGEQNQNLLNQLLPRWPKNPN